MFAAASEYVAVFSGFWNRDFWNVNVRVFALCYHKCVCDTLWHWGKTVDCVWQQCWSGLIHFWLMLIGYWRKLRNVLLHKLYLLPDIIINERKEGLWVAWSCRMNVMWALHTGLSEILNHNVQSTLLFRGLYIYVYLATDTMAYPLLSGMTKFTLPGFTTQSLLWHLTFLLWLC
jgi:hypothetical protein